jgi:hypothetical protein
MMQLKMYVAAVETSVPRSRSFLWILRATNLPLQLPNLGQRLVVFALSARPAGYEGPKEEALDILSDA